MAEEACGLCRHWQPPPYPEKIAEGEPVIGHCRRFPPQVAFELGFNGNWGEYQLSTFSKYPDVQAGNWCGEYKTRKAK